MVLEKRNAQTVVVRIVWHSGKELSKHLQKKISALIESQFPVHQAYL